MFPRFVPKLLSPGHLLTAGTAMLLASGVASLRASVPDNLNLGLKELAQAYKDSAKGTGSKALSHASALPVLAATPEARTDEQDRVITDIYLDGSAPIDDVVKGLEAMGCKIQARIDWYGHGALSVWLPLDKAPKVGRLKGVNYVNLALKPHHNVGKVTSQSGFVLKAEALQGGTTATTTPTGSLGSGVTVGALSDSFDKLKTTGTGTTAAPLYPNVHAVDDVASFDLPGSATHPYGNTTPVNVIEDYTSSTGVEDEGRGMLQIIHDLATTTTGTGVVVSAFNGTTTPAGTTAPSVASFTVGTGSTGTANSLLTVNSNNSNPGATLKFGIGRRNDGVNIFGQLAEVLGGQTPASPGALLGSTTSAGGTPAAGRFANTFKQK